MTASRNTRALTEDVKPREVWAWAMYDFANSGYTTVVITAVFNAYFVAVVAQRAPWATLAWTATLAVSYALIVLTAPLVGAWADARAAKKRLLAFTTIGCVVFTAALYFTGPGTLAVAVVCVIASNFFFGTGENLIAAFLPELAKSRAMGRVSGWGWSLGYLGGLLSLGASLVWLTQAKAAGRETAQVVPETMIITAALFAIASLPTFLFLRERAMPQAPAGGIAHTAWSRLAATLHHARRFRDLSRFLLCTLFYQAGIAAVITLAAIYAQEAMKFTTHDTLVLILVVNLTAAFGAFRLRLPAGPHRPRARHRTDLVRLDTDGGAGLSGGGCSAVLGGGQHRRPVHGSIAIGRPRHGRLPRTTVTTGGILRPVGLRREARLDLRPAHLRPGQLALRRRSPSGHSLHRCLFRRRPAAARGYRHGARPPLGPALGPRGKKIRGDYCGCRGRRRASGCGRRRSDEFELLPLQAEGAQQCAGRLWRRLERLQFAVLRADGVEPRALPEDQDRLRKVACLGPQYLHVDFRQRNAAEPAATLAVRLARHHHLEVHRLLPEPGLTQLQG
ncbi:MAG: MFS transporter [Rhodocyclaceae bacterium]|nr:MFS transporter [Rhodocyclaceae bacterium]